MGQLTRSIAVAALVAIQSVSAAAETKQIVVKGQVRTALIERPAAQGPRPTIIMLHGATRQGADIATETGLDRLAPREGWLSVFPDGRGGRWNLAPPGKETARDAEFFAQHGGLPDDVAFLRALIADLVGRGVSDPKRMHIAGLSLGGGMALRMACLDAGAFAAVGLLVSTMWEVAGADCRPAKPLPLMAVSGTADVALPYAGSSSARGDGIWPVDRLVGFFRQLNGCAGQAPPSNLFGVQPLHIEIDQYAPCAGAPVVLYRMVGQGHDVPPALNAGRLLLDFFRDTSR